MRRGPVLVHVVDEDAIGRTLTVVHHDNGTGVFG